MEQSDVNLVYPGEHDHKLDRTMVCVNYPGKVVNDAKAVETLGGIEELSNNLAANKSKIELRFRPKDIYCHKINGERSVSTGLLLKVRAKKNSRKISSVTIEGVSTAQYSFNGLGDFAFLPIQTLSSGQASCSASELIPNEETPDSSYIFDRESESLFLPPAVFSRIENPHIDIFRKETADETKEADTTIGTSRSKRKNFMTLVPYSADGEVPQRPKSDAFDSVKLRLVNQEKISQIKELFKDRPVWTKAGIIEATKVSPDTLKLILPVVAFYYSTGPWRACWVRFGYDPRKDFENRMYQTIDYRMRKYGSIKDFTTKKSLGQHKKFASAIFNCSSIPEFHLVFYQYCDIEVPQVRKMLQNVSVPPAGARCNEKRGWLPMGFEEQVRSVMQEIVQRNYRTKFQKDIEDTSAMDASSALNDPVEESDSSDLDESGDDSGSDMDIDDRSSQ